MLYDLTTFTTNMKNNQMYFRRFLIAIFIFVILLGNFSCKKDFTKISTSDWNPNIAAPFINTTIVLSNLFLDDSNLVTQPDSSLIYIYHQDSIFSISADTILDLEEDISEEINFSLGELYMDQFGFDADFSMNDILPYLDQDVQDTLLAYDGTEYFFPPFQLNEPATLETPPIENYVQLTFSKGKMFINILNTLPVTLEDIDFEVVDVNNNITIKQISIPELLPDQQQTDSIDLAGLTLGNEFAFIINSVNSSGSFPDMVLIDLEQGMEFGLLANGLRVISGQARIIEQIMYSEVQNIDFPFDPEQLYHIKFSEGIFSYLLNSELSIDVNVNIQLPSALINNQIPTQEFSLTSGGFVNQDWDISSMNVDLTTDTSQPFNRMPIQVEILILPTENIVEFDSSDKVLTNFSMENMNLGFADGYLGKQTIEISQDTLLLDFDFLKRLEGELILEEPSLTIDYVNSIGVPFRISTEFFGINTYTGQTHYLEHDSVDIAFPLLPGTEVEGEILINKDNSTIVEFLAIRPDKIVYFGGGLSNPDGIATNFINDESKLIGNAELIIPLILRADHLSFTDTLGFSGTSGDIPVEEGLIKLNVMNGFPFDLSMSLLLTDSISGAILDRLDFDEIASAIVGADGKVTERVLTDIVVEFDENFLDNMRASNRALLFVETSTFGQGEIPVILYSDYEIDIAIGFLAKINP